VPEDFDRRNFMRRASMGAAAVGALSVAGGSILGGAASADAATPPAAAPEGPVLDGSDVIAQVVDARAGVISILVGTREIKYVDRDLAQKLMRATQ
jgi:hypothetical protein